MKEQQFFTLKELLDGDDDYAYEFEDYQEENFCNWVFDKTSYTPALEVEIVKKLSAGIYKVNQDFKCIPQKISTDGLFILPESKSRHILEEVNKFWNRREAFKKFNLIHKRGMLLVGPPGSGKTSIITLLMQDLIQKDGVIFLVNSIRDFTLLFDFLKGTFRKIEPTRPIITIIEDIDKIINDNIEPEILDFLDGKASIEHHLVIMTSNDTSDLSDALIRPSRIDMQFLIDYPCFETRKKFLELKGVEESDLDKFAEESEGLSISELKELFIGTYVLGNDFENVLYNLKNPQERKEFSTNHSCTKTIGL